MTTPQYLFWPFISLRHFTLEAFSQILYPVMMGSDHLFPTSQIQQYTSDIKQYTSGIQSVQFQFD